MRLIQKYPLVLAFWSAWVSAALTELRVSSGGSGLPTIVSIVSLVLMAGVFALLDTTSGKAGDVVQFIDRCDAKFKQRKTTKENK